MKFRALTATVPGCNRQHATIVTVQAANARAAYAAIRKRLQTEDGPTVIVWGLVEVLP